MIPKPTIREVNMNLEDGNLTIERGILRPVDYCRDAPHPATLDVLCLRHVRKCGPLRQAMLERYLDIACDANPSEVAESLARLKRDGVLDVLSDEVRAVTRPEQPTEPERTNPSHE